MVGCELEPRDEGGRIYQVQENGPESCELSTNSSFVLVCIPVRVVGEGERDRGHLPLPHRLVLRPGHTALVARRPSHQPALFVSRRNSFDPGSAWSSKSMPVVPLGQRSFCGPNAGRSPGRARPQPWSRLLTRSERPKLRRFAGQPRARHKRRVYNGATCGRQGRGLRAEYTPLRVHSVNIFWGRPASASHGPRPGIGKPRKCGAL